MKLKPVIFTDLDGTLLDLKTYSYDKSLPSVNHLRKLGIPVVFCSSKTRAEQEVYQRELKIEHPFIAENGGAIFVPRGYFQFDFDYHKADAAYYIIEMGIPYSEIRRILERLRAGGGIDFRGFGDMSAEEVAAAADLDMEAARRAKAREYSETLVPEGTPEDVARVLNAVKKAKLNYAAGGRFYSITGPNDKGRATEILTGLFRRKLGQVQTIGVGDSPNDLPMLSVVDIPILVQKPGGVWEEMDIPRLRRVDGIGPEGWTRAVEEIVKKGMS
jgi:mannosyl-3-phosphoglycerate phosphatase